MTLCYNICTKTGIGMTQHSPKSQTRRQGRGRRATNSDWSVEERKRWRVLKNRESAMRSLMKKAEHSERLTRLEAEALDEVAGSVGKLKKLLASASMLFKVLEQCGEQPNNLLSQANAAMVRARAKLSESRDKNRS